MTKQEIKSKLLNAFDSVTFKRNGHIVAKRSYFYHNGQSASNLAEGIKQLIPTAFILSAEDHFHNWPNESYFQITFKGDIELTVNEGEHNVILFKN
jgi:hypothetical protein